MELYMPNYALTDIRDMSEECYQSLNNLKRYMRVCNWTVPYEIDDAMEWLSNIIYKINASLVNQTKEE